MTRRLIVSYLVVTVAVLVLLEVPFAVFYAQRERERFTAAVERDASVIATIYEDALEQGFTPDPQPALRYTARTGARVVVVDTSGVSLVDTEQPTPRDFSTRPEIAIALTGARSAGTRPSETLGTDILYVAIPVASSGIVHGAVRVTLDTSDVDANIHRFWLGLGIMGLVVLAAMSLVGWLIARSVALPVRRLIDTARRFGRGDLTSGSRTAGDDGAQGPPEVRELSDTMATMAQRLAAMIDEQRAFVADASHQLRTPLTGLRLRLENLQARLSGADVAEIEAAIDELARLSALVADLLQLARADRHDRAPTPHDLARLATERVDTWSALADGKGIELALACSRPSVIVLAAPGAIEQIIDNVLDNAIDIAPAGSTVSVAVRAGAAGAELVITDQGPGLSDEDKERATRRFWRADSTRAGSGLGLAIASSLAAASGGSLALRDAPSGHGLEVVVGFPPAPADALAAPGRLGS